MVQIAHGLAEHAGRYARLAQALTSAGYAVYASDHRGHGLTCKNKEQLGFFAERNGWQRCLEDLWKVNQRIATEHPGIPIVLLGHSMGATMAQQFIGEHGDALAGVVLSGPSGTPTAQAALGKLILRFERARLGPQGHSKLANSLSFGAFNKAFAPVRTAFDWLSRDPDEVNKYVADPLCGFSATVQLWIDLLDGWKAASTPSHWARIPRTLPIYIIAGDRDPVSGNTRQISGLLKGYQAAGIEQVRHRFYPEARHELFNETNRDQVIGELIAWLDEITGKPQRPG